ncbi:MAG: hypothetical protein COB37_00895 [Kordiimonadales bacterium]|nr:MAG: hypothetical protein COB37_00895 [Kordiimonadales bacterium]
MKRFAPVGLRIAAICLGASTAFSENAQADALDDAIIASQARAEAPLISRSVLLRRQQIRIVKLSPNGQMLAYVTENRRIRQLWMMDTVTEQHRLLFSTKSMDTVYWSADSRYLFLDTDKGISVVPISDASAPSFVINLSEKDEQYFAGLGDQHPHAIYVSLKDKNNGDHGLYRVLPDGTQQLLYRSPVRNRSFVLDADGNVAFIRRVKGYGFEVIDYRGETPKQLLTCKADDPCRLDTYNAATGVLHMRARFGHDLSGIYRVDAATGEKTRVHSDPNGQVDVARVQYDAKTGVPLGANYVGDFLETVAIGDVGADVLKAAYAAISDRNIAFRPDAALKRWLMIGSDPSRAYDMYYLYDAETGTFTQPLKEISAKFRAARPLVASNHIASLVPVHYKVSDGMLQHGYVTLPSGVDLAKAPILVYPHGGPWGRDTGTYSSRVAFMANRGYIVFKPNFRSSIGYGRNYTMSANKDFGDGIVQQDIIDGLNYILSRGIGDGNNMAVVGHSFGGFSVLGALAFTPDLFKVGVAGAPPVDLVMAIRNFKPDATNADGLLRQAAFFDLAVDLNDPEDVKRLSSQSPNAHWQEITKPLYIWAGTRDPKVSVLNVRDYALRLQDGGKPLMFMEQPRSGHSPRGDLAKEAYFYMYEKALADHLGGRIETALSPQLARHLRRIVQIDENKFTPAAP